MARLDLERQNKLQPVRIDYAKQELAKLGITPIFETDTQIDFKFNGAIVHLYPYTGWHTGKSIKDGRGFQNLLKQLTPTK